MEDFVWQYLLTVVTKFPAFFSGGKFFTKINLFGKTTTCLGISQLVGAICRVCNFFSVKESTNYNQF
jgi:hypothetical protein